MAEYIPKYPSQEGDDSNKSSSELLAETLKPIYVPQDLMLAWESHLASYSRDTHELLDQVKDSEEALNAKYQALLARVQKYEQMLQDITMDSNEFTMDSDEVNFTGWNILAQASYWDYLLKKEITKLSDQIKSSEYKGALVTEVTDTVLEGLIADNTYISNVIEALSNTPLIQELDAALNSTTSSLTELQAEYVRLAEKQVADAEALANQLVEKAEQSAASLEAAIAEQLDRIADEAAIRTRLLQELEDKTDAMTADYTSVVDALHTTVIQELTTLQDGITTSVSELKSADEAIITNLDAYKVSNGENIAALQSSVNVVTNAQESTANQVTGLVASYDQLDIGLSKAQADIVTSNKARADGDEALSQQITTINAGLGDANSRIDTVSDAVSSLDSATATKFSQLDTRLGGVDDSIASVRQIANSAVDTNTAQATEISTLNSRMTTTEGDVTKKADASALSNLETKVDNADTALSTRIDALVANLTTPEGTEINANAFNALRAEVTNNSGNIATHTSQITALNSSLDGVNTGLSANADAVADLTTTVTQQGGSITSHSQAIQQLQADLDVAEAGLATKASTTALNTTNTNVSNMDGRVTANTNSLNSLGSRMGLVEGAVSTKLEASALNSYYTKTEADDKATTIAAGEVSKYDAKLVIGGTNLLLNSNFSEGVNSAKWGDNGGGYVKVNDPIYGSVVQTHLPSGLVHSWLKLENNVEYIYSALVKPSNDLYQNDNTPLHYWAGKDNQNQHKIQVLSYSHTLIEAGKWTRINIVFKLVDDADSFRPYIYGLNGVLQLAWTKLERGNKATDWAPNNSEVQQSINANASAIQSTNADVSRIDGVVTSQASSISSLQSSLSDVDTKANTAINNAATAQQTANTAVTAVEANAGIITKLESTLASGVGSRNYLLNSAEVGTTKVISEDFNFMELEIGDVIQMSFDIDITSPVSAGVRDRIGYELYSLLQDGGSAWVGVWLHGASSLGVTKQRVNNSYTVVSKFTSNPKEFYYHNQTEGGAFTVKNVQLTVSKIPVKTWSPAPEDIDAAQSGNASAIAGLQAQVTSIDGRVTANSNSFTTLTSTVNNNYSEMINNYSTKANVDEAVSNNIQKYDAQLNTSLPTTQDTTQVNMWLATVLNPENRSDWDQNTIPDYSWLRKLSVTDRRYLADGDTLKHGWWVNRIVFFRTIVSVTQAKTINLGNFTGDDGHAIYVNQKRVFGWAGYATNAVTFPLPAGVSIIDIAISNGIGGAGFSAQNLLSNQVDWMRAPISPEIQASGAATAVTSIQAQVTTLDGKVTANSSQVTTLSTTVDGMKATGQINTKSVLVDLTGYDEGKAFPIGIPLYYTRNTIRVWSSLDGLSHPSWANHSNGFVLEYEWNVSPYEWGTRPTNREITNASWSWTKDGTSPLIKFDQMGNSSIEVVWLRGGGKYYAFIPDNSNLIYPDGDGKISSAGQKVWWHYYNEFTPPNAVFQKTEQNTATLQITNQTIDGVKAVSTVTVDNNGVMSGYGLISELVNGQVRSAFGVNADTFYIGAPYLNKKPFIHRNDWSQIDGVWVPPGTYIDTALIANATIGTAKIADLAVTGAKIANATITDANINSLNAGKITTGTMHGDRITAGTVSANKLDVTDLSAISANLGTIKVGTANIADGAITNAKIGVAEVDTLRIQGRAVTVPYYYTDTNPVFINSRFGDFPVSSNGSRIVPVVSAFSAYGFTPYAEVFIVCDVGILMSGLYDSVKGEAVSVRLLQGYYDTASGNTPNAKRIDRADTITYYDDPSSPNIGTRWEVTNKSCGAFSRKMTADAYGNIALSLWVSSEGSVRNSTRLIVEPKTEITWYVQELKR